MRFDSLPLVKIEIENISVVDTNYVFTSDLPFRCDNDMNTPFLKGEKSDVVLGFIKDGESHYHIFTNSCVLDRKFDETGRMHTTVAGIHQDNITDSYKRYLKIKNLNNNI